MRIQQIAVTGLFGRFDHVIDLDSNEKVTIMIGPKRLWQNDDLTARLRPFQ